MTKQTTMNTKILKASQPASPTVPEAAFTQEETARLTAGLMALMQAQLRQKTQGDSTSLRVEDATELMESIRFTLMLHLEKHALPNRALLGDDLPALFKQAQQTLFTVTDETRQLYALALQTINPLGSISLRDTLSHIGAFFAR